MTSQSNVTSYSNLSHLNQTLIVGSSNVTSYALFH